MYQIIRVNESYYFGSLKASKIRFDVKDPAAFGFNFIMGQSYFQLSNERSCLMDLQLTMPQSQLSQAKDGAGTSEFYCEVICYIGTITRIIDSNAGIYELDDDIHLCLCWYPVYGNGIGLEAGAIISLMNVHLVHHTCVGQSFLFACTNTTIDIVSFSTALCKPLLKFSSKFRKFAIDERKFMNIIDWLYFRMLKDRLRLLFSHMKDKQNYDSKTIVLDILIIMGYRKFDWIQTKGILSHSACDLADIRYPIFKVETIDALIKKVRERTDEVDGLPNESFWTCSKFDSADLNSVKAPILAAMKLNQYGNWIISDETGSLPIFLADGFDVEIRIGLCLIEDYEIIVEQTWGCTDELLKTSLIYLRVKHRSVHPLLCRAENEELISDANIKCYFMPYIMRPHTLELNDLSINANVFVYGHFKLGVSSQRKAFLFIKFKSNACKLLYEMSIGSVYSLSLSPMLLRKESEEVFILDCTDGLILFDLTSNLSHEPELKEFYDANHHNDIFNCVSDALKRGRDLIDHSRVALLSVQGVIRSKTIKKLPSYLCSDTRSIFADFQQKGQLMGFKNHQLVLKIGDKDLSSQELSIHTTNYTILMPLGLIPGNKVRIRNLVIQTDKNGEIYGSVMATTNILCQSEFGDWVELEPMHKEALTEEGETFQSLLGVPSLQPSNVRCFITSIIEFEFRFRCSTCSSIIYSGEKCNNCTAGSGIFEGSGACQVDDGTAQIYAMISSLEIILLLLKVSASDLDMLFQHTKNCGMWQYKLHEDVDTEGSQYQASKWFRERLNKWMWRRQIRMVGTLMKLQNGSFNPESLSCIQTQNMTRNASFKDLKGDIHQVLAIKGIRYIVSEIIEIDYIRESLAALYQTEV